jgi:hypothetical protein
VDKYAKCKLTYSCCPVRELALIFQLYLRKDCEIYVWSDMLIQRLILRSAFTPTRIKTQPRTHGLEVQNFHFRPGIISNFSVKICKFYRQSPWNYNNFNKVTILYEGNKILGKYTTILLQTKKSSRIHILCK